MKKSPQTRSKSSNRSTNSFYPLLPHESSIQYLNFLENSSQKKSNTNHSPPKIHSQESNLGIYIRIRPFLKNEQSFNKGEPAIKVYSNTSLQIYSPEHQNSHKFDFHEVFSEDCSQNELFLRTCSPLIDNVLKGFNGAMFVYGQTGTGKTYTMGLLNKINEKSEGLVPSALRYLFKHFENCNRNQWEVSMSFYQIYLDEIQDLLNPHEGRNLNIREEKNEPYIEDLTVVTLDNLWQAFELLNAGLTYRSMQATKLNETSSRSHVILTLNVLQRNSYSNEMTLSKANFIDLAGSERVSKASSNKLDRRFEETKFINSSLSTLGTVIASLNEKGKSLNSHVAYRNSKLTRVLKNSLNGDSKVFLIATVSPLRDHVNESISTCVFASRCKELRIRPSLQSIGMEHLTDDIPRLVEYYEGLLEAQRNNLRMMEQELKSYRSSQNNETLNQGLEDINQYLNKLLLSLKAFLMNEMMEIQGIRAREEKIFNFSEGLQELEKKFPGVDPGVFSGPNVDINSFPGYDDMESMIAFIQGISKEIVDGIGEMSRGCKSFEALKKEFLREKPKKEMKESQTREVDYLYRIVSYLFKMACFDREGKINLEKEAEGREKLRKYEGNIEMFLNRIHGKDAPINIEYFKKVEAYMKLIDPLNIDSMSESSDPLMKTLSTLRKYSNNSFHERKELRSEFENEKNNENFNKNPQMTKSKTFQNKNSYENNNAGGLNSIFEKASLKNDLKFVTSEVVDNNNQNNKGKEQTVDKTLKSIIESKNPNQLSNKSVTVEAIYMDDSRSDKMRKEQQRPYSVNEQKEKKIPENNNIIDKSLGVKDPNFMKPKTSIINDKNLLIKEKEVNIISQESKKSIDSNNSHKSLKDLTIAKKQQRLMMENEIQKNEYEKTTKVNFASDVIQKEQKSATLPIIKTNVENSIKANKSENFEETSGKNAGFEENRPVLKKNNDLKEKRNSTEKNDKPLSEKMDSNSIKKNIEESENKPRDQHNEKTENEIKWSKVEEKGGLKVGESEKYQNEVRMSKVIENYDRNDGKSHDKTQNSLTVSKKIDGSENKSQKLTGNEPKIVISQDSLGDLSKRNSVKPKSSLKPPDKKASSIMEDSKTDDFYLNFLNNEI